VSIAEGEEMKTKKERKKEKKKNTKQYPQGESPFRAKNPGVYSNLQPAAVFRKGGIVTTVPTCVGWDTVRYLQLYIYALTRRCQTLWAGF